MFRPTLLAITITALLIPTVAIASGATDGPDETALSAPVYRSGATVGTAKATLSVSGSSTSLTNARVNAFQAPAAGRSWRTRTIVRTGCADPGFEPSTDDAEDFHFTSVVQVSKWRITTLAGTTGALRTWNNVVTCADGQVISGSMTVRLTVKNGANTKVVGSSQLFAAG